MVLGLLFLAAIPTTTGVAIGISEQRKQNSRKSEAAQMKDFHIDAHVDDLDGQGASTRSKVSSLTRRRLDGRSVVLHNGKVWLDEGPLSLRSIPESYMARCFYTTYPDEERKEKELGLVSRISDDPPMLNWIYIDKNTSELKYGNRTQSREHHVGNWDWTTLDGRSENVRKGDQEDEAALTAVGPNGEGLVFDEFEGFVAVEEDEEKGLWALYFDLDDDGLKKKHAIRRKKKVEVALRRVMCAE